MKHSKFWLVIFLVLFSLSFCKYINAQRVEKVLVFQSRHPSLIFEAARRLIPEGKKLRNNSISSFKKELLSTGLISNVTVTLRKNKRKGVTVSIYPKWRKGYENFVIREIEFRGFPPNLETALSTCLKQKLEGELVTNLTREELKRVIGSAIEQIYENGSESSIDAMEKTVSLSYKVESTSQNDVRFIVISLEREQS